MDLNKHISKNLFQGQAYVKKDYRNQINLGSNELHDADVERMTSKFLNSADYSWFHLYPYYPYFREYIAESFNSKKEETLLYPGSDAAIKDLLFVLASNSKSVIVQHPNYYNYQNYAVTYDYSIQFIPFLFTHKNAFVEKVKDALENAPSSILVLTNPCGISGQCLEINEMEKILRWAHEKGHLVIIDEAYVKFGSFDHLGFLGQFQNLVIVRSFSKFPGLAGARLSVVFASEDIMWHLEKLNPMNSISRMTLEYYKFIFENELFQHISASIDQRKKIIIEKVSALDNKVKCFDTKTNFLLFDFFSVENVNAFISIANDLNFAVKNMFGYPGYENYLRLTVPASSAIDRMVEVFEKYSLLKSELI
ncbi:MAG: aminotransferase class I/II-fold pyridoxal phosphate-dependent enzyme [Bacteroidota bacterium]